MPQPSYGPPSQYYPDAQFRHDIQQQGMIPSQGGMGQYGTRMGGYMDNSMQRMTMTTGQPQGMFTRNLIGSLATSASRLTDPNEKIGIWFILQDLSVRTEGNFRWVAPNAFEIRPGRVQWANSAQASILIRQRWADNEAFQGTSESQQSQSGQYR